jgi:hypothetical protein
VIDWTPLGIVKLLVPEVKRTKQKVENLPYEAPVAVVTSIVGHSELVKGTEFAGETGTIDNVETAITKAKKWWSARRTTRRKVAILAAKCISTSTLMDWTSSPLGMNPMRKRVRKMPPRGDVA